MLRLTGILFTIAAAVGAAILTWPQFFRLEQTFPIAQLVSLRPVVAVGFAVLALIGLLVCLGRRTRGFGAGLAMIGILACAANVGILAFRGLGTSGLPEPTADSVRVMTWNTAGEATDVDAIVTTAIAMDVDIVALPETTDETGKAIAVAMRERGNPMWVHEENYQGWDATYTTLLISPDLGDYAVVESDSSGTKNTSVVPSVVAMPVNGEGPTVVAVHAVAPRQNDMAHWRSDLRWIADQCASANVILAGDFNATIDHMSRLGTHGGTLGRCQDAASTTGNGAVGTWDTAWPALLGAPIDHVMTTDAWRATGSVVVTSLDGSGGDHRPVIVQLEPVG
ncbi:MULTISPECIES: endonuclease/exonuclease/phosphatase family protein [Microbacterium]|uniref:Endonuclease/exonuclease/phosphatase family protein n=1 Tax=Microbacterium aquilitoris TaxID=3067307 RepID=A0ABU3GK00_9MICO|nr:MULTISPECIES: endonuclease/exonuclease/phosphatase family protein [unclassified Microbacterium]MDT3331030.1 endonuclease/exonuclease/phosphatase family protein [Microbacterium sp. KSW-18]MDT3344196.1 endonuclease/exonuclease/phosphatase family protein [Microbacterium sp. KSW2-22]